MIYITYSYYQLNQTCPNELMYQFNMAKTLGESGNDTSILVFTSNHPHSGIQVLPNTNVLGICMTDDEIKSTSASLILATRIKEVVLNPASQKFIHIVSNNTWMEICNHLPGLISGPILKDITYTDEHDDNTAHTIAYKSSDNTATTEIPLALTALYHSRFSTHTANNITGWEVKQPGKVIYPGNISQLNDTQAGTLQELAHVTGVINHEIHMMQGGLYEGYTYIFPFMESTIIDSVYLDTALSGASTIAISPPNWVKNLNANSFIHTFSTNLISLSVDDAKQSLKDILYIEKSRCNNNSQIIPRLDSYNEDMWHWLNLSSILITAAGV